LEPADQSRSREDQLEVRSKSRSPKIRLQILFQAVEDLDERLATELDGLAAQVQDTAFKSEGDVLIFQVQLVSFRLTGALRRRHIWGVEDIGWAADSLDLLVS
jgi:hypothetical protein